MRYLIALAPLALLAACGGNKAGNNASANTTATNTVAPAAAPAANTVAPAAAPAAQAGQSRTELVAACVSQTAGKLPAGVDAEALCGCSVDQALAGVAQETAAEACLAQLVGEEEE